MTDDNQQPKAEVARDKQLEGKDIAPSQDARQASKPGYMQSSDPQDGNNGDATSVQFLTSLAQWNIFIRSFQYLADCLNSEEMPRHQRFQDLAEQKPHLLQACIIADMIVRGLVIGLLLYFLYGVITATVGTR